MTWTTWSKDLIKYQFKRDSLLEGLEPDLWKILGQAEFQSYFVPKRKTKAKQVAIRHALSQLGCGWIATNTTPFRQAIGALFDAAENAWNDDNIGSQSNPPDGARDSKRQKIGDVIKIISATIPEPEQSVSSQAKSFLKGDSPLPGDCTSIRNQLYKYGAVALRQCLSQDDLVEIRELANGQANKARDIKKIRNTIGNGMEGEPASMYTDINIDKIPQLRNFERRLWKLLLEEGDEQGRPKRKTILLQYGHGGENWAHQDDNKEKIPIQAVLMLSDPSSFTGGQFYVAKRGKNEKEIERNEVDFRNAGDLVLFNGGKEWHHGMLPVDAKEGKTKGAFARQAIGLLQPY